jgi:flagellar capping protein FliD
MNILPFFALLLTLSSSQIYPGETFNISVDTPLTIQLSDRCMYFVETGTQSIAAKPGNHTVKTTISCDPGEKSVVVNETEETLKIMIVEPTGEYILNYASKLENENYRLLKDLDDLSRRVETLERKVKRYEAEIETLKKEKSEVEAEKRSLELRIKLLTKRVTTLEANLAEKENAVSKLSNELHQMDDIIYKLRLILLLIISLFLGSFAAIIVKRRRY